MPYSKMSDVSPSLKGINPPITLSQANSIASVVDALEGKDGIDNPWAVAISRFKGSHIVEDGKWVRKEGSEFGKKDFVCAVKALEIDSAKYIILHTSNAFVDRERQIISTRALQDYVRRREKSNLSDRVRFWHIPGSDYATIVWQDVVGRVLVEVAKVDNTEVGMKMYHALSCPEEYPDVLPSGWGTSHGFLYPRHALKGGVYDVIEKYETTTLPRHWASNPFGDVMLSDKEVAMELSDKKRDALIALLGADKAQEIIDTAGDLSKSLEDAGVTFKDLDDDGVVAVVKAKADAAADAEDEDAAADAEDKKKKKDEEEDEDTVYELELDEKTLDDIAKAIPIEAIVKSVMSQMLPGMLQEAIKPVVVDQVGIALVAAKKELIQTVTDAKEQVVADALSGTLRLRPRVASKSKETEVDAEEVDIIDKEVGSDPVKGIVSHMMRGVQ